MEAKASVECALEVQYFYLVIDIKSVPFLLAAYFCPQIF